MWATAEVKGVPMYFLSEGNTLLPSQRELPLGVLGISPWLDDVDVSRLFPQPFWAPLLPEQEESLVFRPQGCLGQPCTL